ncbi:hypothetical protein HDU91_006713 [Kappamyces sp. JEL0680]|nr:hypothetical protein HDU91_006713 [Kappamyces sp. JEL0680]
MVLFAKLMQQQRDLTTQGKLSKLKVVEFKALIEKLHLTLSNLKYESQHLVKQIDDCDLQDSLYQDIDLYSIDQFLQLAPEEFRSSPSEHHQMLQRLRFELLERTRMTDVVRQYREQKKSLADKIKEKSAELELLETEMLEILTSSMKLQERLGMPLTATMTANRKARNLPGPLFELYRQFYNYCSEHGGIGSLEVLDEPKGPNDAGYDHHPNIIVYHLKSEDNVIGNIKFLYLIQLGAILVRTELVDQFENMPDSFISSELFPNDNGLVCPVIQTKYYREATP